MKPQEHHYIKAMLMSWQVVLLALGLGLVVAILSTVLFYRARLVMEGQLKDRLMTVATVAGMHFDGTDTEKVDVKHGKKNQSYFTLVRKLNALQQAIPDIRFVYIVKPSELTDQFVFVADGTAALTKKQLDVNGNGRVDENEMPSYPGDIYAVVDAPMMKEGMLHAATDDHIVTDQWGAYLSGYAPIRRSDTGETVAVLGIDMEARQFQMMAEMILSPIVLVLLIIATCLFTTYAVFYLSRRRLEEWNRVDRERAGLMLLTFHQLGGPLTIFKWSLETLAGHGEQPPEEAIADHIRSMQEGITRMDQIINDLHLAARVQEGRVEIAPKDTNVEALLRTSFDDMREVAGHKSITLNYDVPSDLRAMVDPRILQGVLYQILSNAMAYTLRNGHVLLKAGRERNMLTVSVKDDGCGVPAIDLPNMFEKFVRGSNAPRLQPDGNGLGLFIAKGLTEAAGGKIWMKSEEGKGTTVTFTLPVK